MPTHAARSHLALGALLTIALGFGAVVTAGRAAARDAAPKTLVGVVRDSAGVPLPSVWVQRIGAKDRLGHDVWTRTDIDGRFRITKPPEGGFSLRLVPGTTHATDGVLKKFARATSPLDIVMDPGPVLDVHVTDFVAAKGKPPYARVRWTQKDGRRPTRYAPVRRDGTIRFVGVPAGVPLELFTVARPGRPVHVKGLRAGPTRRAVASIQGLTIKGKVVGVEANGMRRVAISVYAPKRFKLGRVHLEPSGAFVISDLPPGSYTLYAQFTSGAISASPPVEVKAGATAVELNLR